MIRRISRGVVVVIIIVSAMSFTATPGTPFDSAQEVRAAGCTLNTDYGPVSGAYYRPACDTHDVCYSGAFGVTRWTCDDQFLIDLQDLCIDYLLSPDAWLEGVNSVTCYEEAGAYHWAVRNFGHDYWGGPCWLNNYSSGPNGFACEGPITPYKLPVPSSGQG